MKESYRRFVPQQFLDYLGKEKFSDIKLGDQVEKEMSVLFSDIRDFTTISEKMTPQQNFNFINDYLSYLEPVISRYHGFIDKYIGDAIMALFPNPDNAVRAALEMLDKLEEFNLSQKKSKKPIVRIGLGIHTGNLMLGVIGGANRMEGTVISDAVNLAARLEGLTKKYDRTIIISDSTKNKMKDRETVEFEFLGETKVKGKEQSTEIYSVTKILSLK
jgi:class 3 adenylate cyclase